MTPVRRNMLLRVDACPGSPLIEGSKWLQRGVGAACIHDESVQEFRKKLARRFKLKLQGAWIATALDVSLRPFLDHVEELSREGMARLGSGYLTERLAYSEQSAWYRLEPPLEFNDRNRKGGAAELLSQPWHEYASDRFRAAVERARLRGLVFGPPSFEPIKGDARRWFACLSGALAGRGLDHEWAPPREEDVDEGNGRLGADSADNDTAILDRLDPAVAGLCRLIPPGQLHLKSFPRLWAGSLPDAGFAGLAGVAGTGAWTVDSILIRRSAAAILLGAGVLRTEMLTPVEVIESRLGLNVPILDEEIGPLPGSLIARVAGRRSLPSGDGPEGEPEEVSPALVIPPPIDGADRVGPEEIRSAASALGLVVPSVWQRFLAEIGRTYLGEMIPSHPSTWVEDQPDHEDLKARDDTLPVWMLAIGASLNGDWFSLDLDEVSVDGDCPLLKFDHETDQCVDRWPSLAGFIKDRLTEQAPEGPQTPPLADFQTGS